MAKLILPFGGTSASGSVANLTYYSRRGAQCVRARVDTPNPDSAAQLSTRADKEACSLYWRTLSAAQRRAWSAIAEPPISGYNLFTRAWFVQVATGQTPGNCPPISELCLPPVGLEITPDATDFLITADSPSDIAERLYWLDIFLHDTTHTARAPDQHQATRYDVVQVEYLPLLGVGVSGHTYHIWARWLDALDNRSGHWASASLTIW